MHCIPESTLVCHLSPDISRHEKIIAGQVILVGRKNTIMLALVFPPFQDYIQ